MSAQETNQPLVVCFNETRYGYCRDITRGFFDFVRLKPQWNFVHYKQLRTRTLEMALRSGADGFVAHCSKSWLLDALNSLNVPVVNTSRVMNTPFPTVGTHDFAVGHLAARHLLDRGLRRFLIIRTANALYCKERMYGFVEAIEAVPGTDLRVVPLEGQLDFEPKKGPVGVFALTDREGVLAIRMAQQQGLNVPWQVAVVGADNDDLLVHSTRPAISSVRIPGHQVGYRATQLLDELLHGSVAPADDILIDPQGIEVRGSSEREPDETPIISSARKFVHEHLADPISVESIVEATGVSRSKVEAVFREGLGITPLALIHEMRIERACELLNDTDLPIPRIAVAVGFHDARQLWRVFRRLRKTSPEAYRKQYRIT